jgi:hypothetical protein
MLGRLLGVALVAVGMAGQVGAQVSIRVVDSSGRAVPAVRVDVIGRAEVISVASTSGVGVAELSPERWSEARRLSLSHLGYQTLIVQVEDIPSDGVIAIEPEAIPLDGVSVAVGQLCPITDDARARQLWSQVAALYATDTASRAWFAYMTLSTGTVPGDQLLRTSDAEARELVATGQPLDVFRSDFTRRGLDEQIASEGYAWPPVVIGGTTDGVGWRYPELHRTAAHHFASRAFGELHDFAVVGESEGSATLAFCGRSSGPRINGTISLSPGRAFLGAEWRFETGDPNQGAGGSATFQSFVDGGGARHLVTSRGLFYRHSGVEQPYPDLPRSYARDVTTDVRWYLLPSGAQPCPRGFVRPGGELEACVARYWVGR